MEIDSSYSTRIKENLLDELSKESLIVVSAAYLYPKNCVNYGCDITKAWSTAVEQASVLERVKIDAQAEAYDSFKKDYEKQLKADMVAMLTKIQTEIEELKGRYAMGNYTTPKYVKFLEVLHIIDKYKESEEEK